MAKFHGSPEERFWHYTRITPSCWEWTSRIDTQGYPRMTAHGKMVGAHRFSYELHQGPIPHGLTIDHLCVNTTCVNPAHLEAVTNMENVLRRIQRLGQKRHPPRTPRPPRAPNSCQRGHEFTPENTYEPPCGNPPRQCRTCHRERQAANYKRKKALS